MQHQSRSLITRCLRISYAACTTQDNLPKFVKQLLTSEQSDVLKTTSDQDVLNTLFDEETTLVTSVNTIVGASSKLSGKGNIRYGQ